MPPIRTAVRRKAGRVKRRAKILVSRTRARTEVQAEPPAVIGMVEVFEPNEVLGWVAVDKGAAPIRAGIYINDFEAVGTWVTDPSDRKTLGEARAFRLQLRDIWQYAKKSDRITVRVCGQALPIAHKGTHLLPARSGKSSVAALREKFARGYVFGHNGKLQLSKKLDTDWQHTVMSLYDRVRAIVKDKYGHDVFFIYGSLLGAVREGGFIGHDMDFDAAYVSKHTNGPDAAKELQQIAFTLIEGGLDVKCMRTALHIHGDDNPSTRIDLFHLYFDAEGRLSFPFGIAGTTKITRDQWQETREFELAGSSGLVPVNAEAMVEHIYGAGWRSPNPGFNWNRDRTTRAREGILALDFAEEVYWTNFYAHTEYTSGSTFFEAVNTRPDTPGIVIDIGCGDGRDSYAFAMAGRRVLGLDRSHVGLQHAAKKAQEMDYADRVDFRACDVSDAELLRCILTETLTAAGTEPVLFYARFFLHSVPEDTQNTLMNVIADIARDGDYFAAEFRTDKDETNTKVHTKHYRRFQNGPAFGHKLHHRHGFTILHEHEGTGLSPYQDEDPDLYRVIGRREASPESGQPSAGSAS